MKILRVGMRVRILWSDGWPELSGQEGVIVGKVKYKPGIDVHPSIEWEVAPDCWGTCDAPRESKIGGNCFAPSSDQLEPLYDGNETVTWESCAWKPEGVTT